MVPDLLLCLYTLAAPFVGFLDPAVPVVSPRITRLFSFVYLQ